MAMTNNNKKGLNVPPLRFPEFKGEWITERIGTDCDVRMCKRIFASQTNPTGGVPFYKIGTIGGKPDSYISKELFEKYKSEYNYPKAGEVMLTCAGTIGRCFQYDGSPSYFQDSNIVWIDNPKEKITNDFLFYALQRHDWRELNTTTITRLYNDDIRNIDIVYPQKKKEQEKICRLILLIDRRIEVQRKTIEDLGNFKSALLYEVFSSGKINLISGHVSDFLTTSDDRRTCLPSRERLISVKLNELGVEKSMNTETLKMSGTQYYVRSAGEFIYGKQNIFHGSFGIVPSELDGFCSSGDVPTMSFFPGINKGFFLRIVSFYNRSWERYASGTGSKRIHEEQLLSIPIQYPPKELQNTLESKLEKIDSIIHVEKKILGKLETNRRFLLASLLI